MSTSMGQTNTGGQTGEGQSRSGQSQTAGAQTSAGQTSGSQTGGGMSGGQMSTSGRTSGGQMTGQSGSHEEGSIARTIEQQTAKLPSDTFLWAAVGSMGASALLRLLGKKHASLFVGDWVAPMLLFGVYNKIVKLHGSDRGH